MAVVLVPSGLGDSPGLADCLKPDGWRGAWSLRPIDDVDPFLEDLGLCVGERGGEDAFELEVGVDVDVAGVGFDSGESGALPSCLGGILISACYCDRDRGVLSLRAAV